MKSAYDVVTFMGQHWRRDAHGDDDDDVADDLSSASAILTKT